MKIEGNSSTAAGLRALVATMDKMGMEDSAKVSVRKTRADGLFLIVEMVAEPVES